MSDEISKLIEEWDDILQPRVPTPILEQFMNDIHDKLGDITAQNVWFAINHRYPDLFWSYRDRKIVRKSNDYQLD